MLDALQRLGRSHLCSDLIGPSVTRDVLSTPKTSGDTEDTPARSDFFGFSEAACGAVSGGETPARELVCDSRVRRGSDGALRGVGLAAQTGALLELPEERFGGGVERFAAAAVAEFPFADEQRVAVRPLVGFGEVAALDASEGLGEEGGPERARPLEARVVVAEAHLGAV